MQVKTIYTVEKKEMVKGKGHDGSRAYPGNCVCDVRIHPGWKFSSCLNGKYDSLYAICICCNKFYY